ncbi:hypothetical protein GCM10020256_38160 [Streptomyces thermocoprophilus]
MDGGDADPGEGHPDDLVLACRFLHLRAMAQGRVHGLQPTDEEVLDLYAGRAAVLADVLDGVDEAGHDIGDLGAQLFVHLAVQGVDDGGVSRLDPASGG